MSDHSLLLLATLILISEVLVPLTFPRWPLWGKAAWRVMVLAVLTWLVQRLLNSPIFPRFHATSAVGHLWEQIVEAGWWVVAARSAIGLSRLLIVLEGRPRETRIISDLFAGAIYVATFLAVVNFVFAVPIAGLLATSGVFAIVLGLALQSTLSDVFSGIAVGVERPYKAGDFLWVEGGIEGHVLQVNWRSTHISTGQNNIAVVPNSIIAKARLVNHSLRSAVRSDTIEVRLDPLVMAEDCMTALEAALRACRLPLALPAASVAQTGLHGDGAIYEIKFSVSSSEDLVAARTEIFARVQRHLRHAAIPLAVSGHVALPPLTIPTPAELLERSDLFGLIAAPDRDVLATYLASIRLKPGETLIRQGDVPDALFIIASGTVEIISNRPDHAHLVRRLSPGGSIGAIGLITGVPYGATATALTAVKAYRLDMEGIAAAIETRPELANGLEALARQSEMVRDRVFASEEGNHLDAPEMFLSRMRSFLHKLASSRT